jgi:hypothetical protein
MSSQQLAKIAVFGASGLPIYMVDVIPMALASSRHRIADCDNAGVLLGEKRLPVVRINIARADKAKRDTIAWQNCASLFCSDPSVDSWPRAKTACSIHPLTNDIYEVQTKTLGFRVLAYELEQ